MSNSLSKLNLLELADNYGTPLYVYDGLKIREKASLLSKMLSEKFNIYYSIKANPNINILSFIRKHVTGVEAASAGEIFLALEAGYKPECIIFIGPGKTKEELDFAIKNEIGCIVIESIGELGRIEKIAREMHKKVNIAIRINPSEKSTGARFSMSGKATQFGIDQDDILKLKESMEKLTHVKIIGLHVYYGTQILDYNSIVENFNHIFKIAESLENSLEIKLELIDFGGGFGIPYFEGEDYLNSKLLIEGLDDIMKKFSSFSDRPMMNLIVESGRFLVGESGYLITKVIEKKNIKDKTFLVVDGGSNIHSTAANMGRFIRRNFPIEVIRNNNNNDKYTTETVNIVGPLCTPTDILNANVNIPITEVGDYIILKNSGAYGLSASMISFLSHKVPAEILMIGRDYHLIRYESEFEDLLLNQPKLFKDNKGESKWKIQ